MGPVDRRPDRSFGGAVRHRLVAAVEAVRPAACVASAGGIIRRRIADARRRTRLPLHEAGERSFALHMTEHELIMLLAAPRLMLAEPLVVLLWAFPAAARRDRDARDIAAYLYTNR